VLCAADLCIELSDREADGALAGVEEARQPLLVPRTDRPQARLLLLQGLHLRTNGDTLSRYDAANDKGLSHVGP
jgi:hypothetical protein